MKFLKLVGIMSIAATSTIMCQVNDYKLYLHKLDTVCKAHTAHNNDKAFKEDLAKLLKEQAPEQLENEKQLKRTPGIEKNDTNKDIEAYLDFIVDAYLHDEESAYAKRSPKKLIAPAASIASIMMLKFKIAIVIETTPQQDCKAKIEALIYREFEALKLQE